MIKDILKNESGSAGLVTGIVMVIISLAVLTVGLPILQGMLDSTSLDAGTYSTGTLTLTNVTIDAENITIGDYILELDVDDNGVTAGNIDVTCSDATAAVACLAIKTAINGNTSLAAMLTSTNTSTTVTCTYDTVGTSGNIASTENMANATWGAVTLTGGTDADSLYTSSESVVDTTESSYSMASVIPTVIIAIPVLGALFGLIFFFGGRRG